MGAEHGQRCRPKSKAALRARPELRRDLQIARSLHLTREQFYALPEDEIEAWIADWEIERGHCSFHGGPVEECEDDDRDWFPQRYICRPAMELAAAGALYEQRHSDRPFHDGSFPANPLMWSENRTRATPYRYDEGVTIGLTETDENPDDNFLG